MRQELLRRARAVDVEVVYWTTDGVVLRESGKASELLVWDELTRLVEALEAWKRVEEKL